MIASQLSAASDADDDHIIEHLETLSHIPVDMDLLLRSQVAHATKAFKSHSNQTVRTMIRKLRKSWKFAMGKEDDEDLEIQVPKSRNESRRGSTASTATSPDFEFKPVCRHENLDDVAFNLDKLSSLGLDLDSSADEASNVPALGYDHPYPMLVSTATAEILQHATSVASPLRTAALRESMRDSAAAKMMSNLKYLEDDVSEVSEAVTIGTESSYPTLLSSRTSEILRRGAPMVKAF
jgi:hypothetical protein